MTLDWSTVGPVRWGILSTARVARTRIVPALKASPSSVVHAVASRAAEPARLFAEEFGIPRAYGSYQELFDDPDIDVVYIGLPNHLHVETALLAAGKGKHVLCEKPIGLNAREAARLKEIPDGILVAEAFMIRHHPQWHEVQRVIASGRIGAVRAMQVVFGFTNLDPTNIRNRPETGGGALLDLGCYAVVAARTVFAAEPRRVLALIDRDPAMKTDRTASFLADFGDGRQFAATVSTQMARSQHATIAGTTGRIDMPAPFSGPSDARHITIAAEGRSDETVTFHAVDQYALQVEAFSRAVAGAEPWPYGIDDAINNMRVLDALLRSEASGAWERP